MSNLIGLGVMILGGVTGALFPNPFSFIVMFLGAFFFFSFPHKEVFVDYVIADTEEALVRERYYFRVFLFEFALIIFTLGLLSTKFLVMWKEEYFKITEVATPPENLKLSRKEYIALLKEQRHIYSTKPLSREFMEKAYSPKTIGFKRKKLRLILAIVPAALILTTFADPGAFFVGLAFELILIPLIILWIPDYKNAKILQQAYDRAMNENVHSL